MSISGGNGRSTADRAKNAYEFVARPIQNASLFYTTYWLSEIKGITDAGFEFNRLRDTSFVAFQDYGIYSVISEISNLHRSFNVRDQTLMNLPFDEGRESEEHFVETFLNLVEVAVDEDLIYDLFIQSSNMRRITAQELNRPTFVKSCNAAESFWDAFSRPKRFLRACRALFGHGYDPRTDTGWSTNYGGPAWEGVCTHLLAADSQPKTVWVDSSWGIQHNNSNWLDKVEPALVETNHLERLADFPTIQNPRKWVYGVMLEQLLDWNQSGDWESLYPIAASYTEHVGINLRRLAPKIGIELDPSDKGIVHTNYAREIDEVGRPTDPVPATKVKLAFPKHDEAGNETDLRNEANWREELTWMAKDSVLEEGDVISILNSVLSGAVAGLPDINVEVVEVWPGGGPAYVNEGTDIQITPWDVYTHEQ